MELTNQTTDLKSGQLLIEPGPRGTTEGEQGKVIEFKKVKSEPYQDNSYIQVVVFIILLVICLYPWKYNK